MRHTYFTPCTNILYEEPLLRNFIKVKFGGPMIGLIIGIHTPENELARQLLVWSPVLNFIDIRRIVSEIKHADE